jgi:hypothetical protein
MKINWKYEAKSLLRKFRYPIREQRSWRCEGLRLCGLCHFCPQWPSTLRVFNLMHTRREYTSIGRRSMSKCSKFCSCEADMESRWKKNFTAQHCTILHYTFILATCGPPCGPPCANEVAHASVVLPRESWKIWSPVDRTTTRSNNPGICWFCCGNARVQWEESKSYGVAWFALRKDLVLVRVS